MGIFIFSPSHVVKEFYTLIPQCIDIIVWHGYDIQYFTVCILIKEGIRKWCPEGNTRFLGFFSNVHCFSALISGGIILPEQLQADIAGNPAAALRKSLNNIFYRSFILTVSSLGHFKKNVIMNSFHFFFLACCHNN